MKVNQDANRPKLKKIKRPINRTSPLGVGQNMPQGGMQQPQVMQQPQAMQQPQRARMPNSAQLNEFLDGPTNLPDLANPNSNYIPNNHQQTDFTDDYLNDEYPPYDSNVPSWLNIFAVAVFVCLAMGVLIGKVVFAQSKVVKNGLQGVVVNSEVPRGRARCGIAERSQGCVLYVMNPQRQDMSAKDFYDIASQMTGRQRFMIETGNMRYANTKIKPGDIVQLNIPPL